MEQLFAKLVELVLKADQNWPVLLLLIVVAAVLAVGRAVLRAKRFRLVIEYIAGDK